MVGPLLFAALAATFLLPGSRQAKAQPAPEAETFMTADGVMLRGLFLPSAMKPATDPVVMLLYPPGKDNNMDKGEWKGLAKMLAEKGYSVFRFDWRGHGKSTDIKDAEKFWNIASPNDPNPNPFTGPWHNARMITGAPAPGKKIKDDLHFKDLKAPADRYLPVYLTDLAAARHHLDLKNNRGATNTSSIYVIGAESAATLGLAFMATEWARPAVAPGQNLLVGAANLPLPGGFPTYKYVPQPLNGAIGAEAGKDFAGAVWLSAVRPMAVRENLVKNWATGASKLRNNTPMLFLYGDKDDKAKSNAEFFFNQVLVAKPPGGSPLQKLDQTFEQPLKGSGKASGASLLAVEGTNDTIVKYIDAVRKVQVTRDPQPRGYTEPWFIALTDVPGLNQGYGFSRP